MQMTNNYTLDQCRQRLLELTELKDGWFDGYGKAISMDALDLADKILLASTLRPYIYPMYEGGVTFEWDTDMGSWTLYFRPDITDPNYTFIDFIPDSNNTIMWTASLSDKDNAPLISSIIEVINNYK